MFEIISGVLEQGFIYGIMALGVYISYKILNFPDLTVDGSFPLGAAVTAVLLTAGVNPWIALALSFAVGICAGLLTGIIHVKLKVNDLLSGIIVMTALYSINYRIAGKSANIPIFDQDTIFNSGLANFFPQELSGFVVLFIVFIVALVMKFAMDWYLNTKSGFLLRATGDNKHFVTAIAKDYGIVKIIGLAISNAFVAMAGSVVCQQQKLFDITMGTGTIVIGLAAVIIGINVFKPLKFLKPTTMVLGGSIIYKACVAVAFEVGFDNADIRLITAVLFLIALIANGKIIKVREE
ncbi:ABC transporter permease [Bacillota bacterium LX-D]|nr:ABC transporter permease [Bacillota bacterium LX-D]